MASKESRPQKFTGFRSLSYRSGLIYNFLTQRLYDQKKKFCTIARLCGTDSQVVLDLPCGTGYLTRYLDNTIEYHGWDLNHRFLSKIKKDWFKGRFKQKRIILQQNDIFDYNKYPQEGVDVIVFCDILHHVYPRHLNLVENAKKYTNKIIVCEPVAVKPQDIRANDWLAKIFVFLSKFLPERLLKLMDFLFADNDGINSYENRSEWKHNEESLKAMYQELGLEKIYNLGDDYIGIWEK